MMGEGSPPKKHIHTNHLWCCYPVGVESPQMVHQGSRDREITLDYAVAPWDHRVRVRGRQKGLSQ